MSAPPSGSGKPIESRDQLVAELSKGEKPVSDWKIGTEHEKFAFTKEDLKPLPFAGERSISTLLEGMAAKGWTRLEEDGTLFALTKDGANITLEPGGQMELSGAPLENLHQTCDEVHTHLADLKGIADPLGIGFLGIGMQPKWTLEDTPKVPRERYAMMRNYMPKVGSMGLEMMHLTCTIQTNLDFSDEADMVKKLRTSLALQPIATALFANSPFRHSALNGKASYRNHIWSDTDNDRAGGLHWAFDDGMGYDRYVDYALDVPMYFVFREGRYVDTTGQSFRDFLDGRLPALPGEVPTDADWANHLTTIFPDVRLKSFLEMRGADGGPWSTICALPAFWVGLMYDAGALDAAWDLVKDWGEEDRLSLAQAATAQGLAGSFTRGSILEVAKQALEIANQGLKARAKAGTKSADETEYLEVLFDLVAEGRSPSDRLIDLFNGEWKGSVDPVFKHLAY